MLLLDGLTCHRNEEFSLKVEQNNIHLQVLLPHETHAPQPLDALQELDYDYSISPFSRDVSGFRKEALKEKTIKNAFEKSGMWPIRCKNALLLRSRYVGHQDFVQDNSRPETNYQAAMLIKEVSIYIQETLGSPFPAAFKEELEAAHELILNADHQKSRLVNLEASVAEQRMRRN
ncbi:hypothetical protein EPUL_001486 [Erysiphe pulchra]|uniref:DDE-1 domain-containing protein n=1 Tax=Erysiphe pulchra TaxID=225359 RepID=A0A2S4PWH6_9PEZI|nr:hypothetical protein EPUL_001486 [Erysiphe pulchra]